MGQSARVILLAIFGLFSAAAAAVTVVECEGPDGKFFSESCPPGTSKTAEKKLLGIGGTKNPTMAQIAADHPITIYVTPDCDACDLIRNALSSREIPFSEVNVQDNAELQQQLQSLSGGLTVPTTVVGNSKPFTGYSRAALDAELTQAGYPVE